MLLPRSDTYSRLLPAPTAALATRQAAGANHTRQSRGKARRPRGRDPPMQTILLDDATHRAQIALANARNGYDGHVVRDAFLTQGFDYGGERLTGAVLVASPALAELDRQERFRLALAAAVRAEGCKRAAASPGFAGGGRCPTLGALGRLIPIEHA